MAARLYEAGFDRIAEIGAMTIGMVDVASRAANAAGVAMVRMRSTGKATSSAARAG
jgi:hypothetical protein